VITPSIHPDFHQLNEAIELELRSVFESRSEPLYNMMRYQLGWIDEHGIDQSVGGSHRMRALWCLLSCHFLGGDFRKAIAGASAVELAYQYSLIHDDIQTGNSERGFRAPVWWVWGPGQAINAGDGLHALARLTIFRLADSGVDSNKILEATRLLDHACLQLCEGQYLELRSQDRIDLLENEYLRMAETRTGSLIGCAAELGALVTETTEAQRSAIGEASRKLGVSLQIRQELDILWGTELGAPPSGNILNKQKFLAVVHVLKHGEQKAKRQLGTLYLKRILEPTDIPHLLSLLEATGAKEYCINLADQITNQAMDDLHKQGLPSTVCENLRSAWGTLTETS
jgi:geranylgeranyl diphosphate synthase type I